MAISLLAFIQPAWAGLESGVAAYDAGEYSTAYRELYPLAMREDPVAAYLLSRMYLAGQGMPQNSEEGLKWLRLAADRSEVAAQLQLGTRYEHGIGLAQSDAEAFRWYKKAADLGSPVGQLYVGMMYSNARGVTGNLVAAHMWLNLATAALPPGQIRNSAAKLRDSITARLSPEQLATAHGLARNWKPAKTE
ncbi:MAG: sel1 repeat family protein [Proteobacteria bacterium]|nr:sel1 repeat family protein [Pseudomonadota bacterium]